MKKRVLSMLLAFILCFSTLPMTAFAQDADVVTEQEEQQEADSAEEQKEQQEADSAEEQEEQQKADSAEGQEEQQEAVPVTEQKKAEAAAEPGEETSSDKSTTVETPATEDSTAESVSDSDAGTQDTGADDEKKAAVQKVQALIDALPEKVTVENAESVSAQLEAIAEAMDSLTKEQIAELDMTRLHAISEALNTPMTVAESEHIHPVCGKEHHDVCNHTTDSQVTFTKLWMDNGKLKIGDTELTAKVTQDKGYFDQGQNVMCYELPADNYYLGSSITLDYPIYIASHYAIASASKDVKLCLNGYTITANGDFSAIVCSSVVSKTTFTLTDCQQTAGTITHAANKTGSGVLLSSNGNGTRFNMYGGSLTHNTAERGGGVNIVANGDGGIFNLYGGVISANEANDAGGGVYIDGRNATFTMYGGEITNNTAGTDGGGVSSASAKFIMNGGSITGNTAVTGGGVSVGYHSSTDFTMNGGEIKNNMASDNGGGVYMGGRLRSYTFTLNGTPDISENTKDGVANNVYLSNGAVITVGNLGANVQIPVTLEKMPTEGFYVKFAKAGAGFGLNDNIARQFIIENDGSDKCDKWIIENDPDELWLYVKGEDLHRHAICGESCDHEPNHSKVLWTPLTYHADTRQMMCGGTVVSSNKLPDDNIEYTLTAGNYYLPDDITFAGTIIISGNVNFCLNGRSITNSPQYFASTFEVPTGGKLTLCDHEGGTITSTNKALDGSNGVLLYARAEGDPATFTMYGGTITGNKTGVYGNNAFVPGVFNMYGGVITGNKTGASIPAEITMTVGGTAKIIDNTEINVYLYEEDKNSNSKSIIHIDSSLTDGASIGVTTDDNILTAEAPVQIATGACGSVKYTEIFKADWKDQGGLVTKDAQGDLYLSSHRHSWKYTLDADGKTITATCVNTTKCPNTDGGSVTIKAPEENTLIYDGSNKTAILENKLLTGEKNPTISYTVGNGQGATLLDGSYPTNAGQYTASITVGGVIASVTYEIQKADPAADNFVFTVPGSLTYDGTSKTADVKTATNITGMGDVMVKYYQGETEVQPRNAGDYKVKISVADGTNFNAAI